MKLENLRVIDASTVLAGPSVGMFFAELGAHVLKIENPQFPDVTRSWKNASETPNFSVSSYFSSINYRKEYRTLNYLLPEDHQAMLALIKDADILITNFKKGDVEKFQLTDDQLFAINPRLIHGKISGFGSDSDRVAYDLILQAETGFMSMNGTTESGPVKMPVALIDVLTAHQLKEAILLALFERTSTNLGKALEVSLYDTAVCSLVNQASAFLMTQHIPQRIGSLHPSIAPYGELFTTSDAAQLTFAIGSDKHFAKLCSYLALDALTMDSRFINNQQRVIHRADLRILLQEKLQFKQSAEVLISMENHSVPCGKIQDLQEVFAQSAAQQFVREETIDGVPTKRVSSIAFKEGLIQPK